MNTATNIYTAKVSVYAACECSRCASGARWFSCLRIDSRFVASYECTSINPADAAMGSCPSVESVRDIAREHPGCVFVFDSGFPGADRVYAAALRGE
jgi:hypothetical protein